MNANEARIGLILTGCLIGFIAIVLVLRPQHAPLPDFSDLEPDERKAAFFEFLAPLVAKVNDRSIKDRNAVTSLTGKVRTTEGLSRFDRRELAALAQRYEVDTTDRSDADILGDLQRRTGVIPESLILIQAAKESGWGTSRFATEGNNLFGQRCYENGCGIAPRGRARPTFGLASFRSVEESIESYVMNLNTHPEYRDLRELRGTLRKQDRPLLGHDLAQGLLGYSERGQAYVDEIRSMIRQNDLE